MKADDILDLFVQSLGDWWCFREREGQMFTDQNNQQLRTNE